MAKHDFDWLAHDILKKLETTYFDRSGSLKAVFCFAGSALKIDINKIRANVTFKIDVFLFSLIGVKTLLQFQINDPIFNLVNNGSMLKAEFTLYRHFFFKSNVFTQWIGFSLLQSDNHFLVYLTHYFCIICWNRNSNFF